jgi:DnaJ-class molecular chaperone
VRIPEQIRRLAVVIGVLATIVLVTRFVLIPRSLVSSEIHVTSAVAREIAKPVKFAGSTACQDCHDDVVAKKAKGFHKNLACEGCHGPAAKHADDPSSGKPPAPRDRKFCPACHAYDPSRPTGFPQINVTAHNPLKPCIGCHNPHDPVPPHVPQSCSACHAQIERTKAVSSHALLSCTTCHKAPEQHRRDPRTAIPSKPESRDFCATCHAKGATNKEAPKIDASTHGGRTLCWECHYPHLPEGHV